MDGSSLPLKDIHLPEPIGWWPPAMGWWISLILLVLLSFLAVYLYKQIKRQTAIKTAKKLLLQIKQDAALSDQQKLMQLSQLIRRVAISVAPRKETAGLTGQAWLDYLDSSLKGRPFSESAGRLLLNAPYQKNLSADINLSAFIHCCEDWLQAQKNNKK